MTLYSFIKTKLLQKQIEIICGNIDAIGETLTELNRRLKELEKP